MYIDTTRIWDSPFSGQIHVRLTGGKYSSQGLLRIYCNGEWGTACDGSPGTMVVVAQVIYRQLEYNSYYTYDTLKQ